MSVSEIGDALTGSSQLGPVGEGGRGRPGQDRSSRCASTAVLTTSWHGRPRSHLLSSGAHAASSSSNIISTTLSQNIRPKYTFVCSQAGTTCVQLCSWQTLHGCTSQCHDVWVKMGRSPAMYTAYQACRWTIDAEPHCRYALVEEAG